MSSAEMIRALLVDPSLFTAPYDAALTEGLLAAGVEATWATRPTRRADRQALPRERVDAFFYRWVDEALGLPHPLRAVAKAFSHVVGLCGLVLRVHRRRPDIVHFQWTVLPCVDAIAILIIRLRRPVVLTVHDPVPFNGERRPWLQTAGFDLPVRLADRVIVHTQAGRRTLLGRGVSPEKVTVIPHGPLRLNVPLPARRGSRARTDEDRWTFLLFGELKPYKGLDLLIEALGLLPEPTRRKARVIIAGRPRMDLTPVMNRIAALGLCGVVEVRPRRLSEEEIAALFEETDCFVFPYRQIDASGVYFLVKSLGKWMIASRVGIFAEDLREGTHGDLVPADDAQALSGALEFALRTKPIPLPVAEEETWTGIGHATADLYGRALDARKTSAIAVQNPLEP